MIEVSIKSGDYEVALIRITNLEDSLDPELGNYSIEFGVDTIAGFAVYQRSIEAFPRKKFNALALVRQALMTLEEKELSLDGDPDHRPRPPRHAGLSRYLARRFH